MNNENKTPTPGDMDTVRFISLISMFASSAYQSMGKIANPMTGKVERNLDGAQGMIDILVTIEKKTKGNLTSDEERMLTSTISDLQMNFVKEREKPEPEQTEEKDQAADSPAGKEEGAEKVDGEDEDSAAAAAEKDQKQSEPVITPPPAEDQAGKDSGEDQSENEKSEAK